jgi:hypothetical protein
LRPTQQQLEAAVAQMTILRYFPAESIARAMVMDLLSRLVGTAEQLNWLTRTLVDRVGEWHGPAELRGIFCTRFKPADGIEADCSVRGFTAGDSEMAHITAPAPRYLPAPDDEAIPADFFSNVEALAKSRKLKAEGECVR